MTSLTAVVVQYRGGEVFRRCVAACQASGRFAEVIVVDNEGVADRLRREYRDPSVRVVELPGNVGYGAAANAGLDDATTDAAVVLNQDAIVTAEALDRMVSASLASGAWIVGPALVDHDGTPAPPKTGFSPPLAWRPPSGAEDGWRWIPWVAGAAMLFAPGHADLRFDPRLFMYAEDEELCWRVWASGGRVVQAPAATVIHGGGSATRQAWGRREVAARMALSRARMVAWHAGWRAVPRFVAGTLRQRRRRAAAER